MSIVVQNPSTAAASQEIVDSVAFQFDTPSPMILRALSPGEILDRAAIVVDTTFDGAAPSLELGTYTDPGGVLDASQTDATHAGQYESDLLLQVASPDFLILTIAPGASTQGAGIVFFKVKL